MGQLLYHIKIIAGYFLLLDFLLSKYVTKCEIMSTLYLSILHTEMPLHFKKSVSSKSAVFPLYLDNRGHSIFAVHILDF